MSKENPPSPHLWQSDLACERHRADERQPGIERRVEEANGLRLERISVTSEEGAASIGRPMGHYDTLTTPPLDTLDEAMREITAEAVSRELSKLALGRIGHTPSSLLVVGLGNASMTADAIGPQTAEKIHATRHIRAYDEAMFRALACAEIAVLQPGVSAQSGLDAADIVQHLCRSIRPEAVLVFDALAARATDRLGCTIQLADTGISPGSGVGNHRKALDADTLGCPVLSVGVPTVTDSRIFFREEAARCGISAADVPSGEGMFVSPRGIDEIVACASDILSSAVNRTFGISFS